MNGFQRKKMSEKVQIILFKKQSNSLEVLLLQTNKTRGLFWQNITGGVESYDQSLIKTAAREISEETSIVVPVKSINSLEYSYQYFDQNRQINYTEHLFYAIVKNTSKVIISLEHNDFKWVPAKEIRENDFHFKSNFDGFCRAYQVLRDKE